MDGLAALRSLPPEAKPEGQRCTSSALVHGQGILSQTSTRDEQKHCSSSKGERGAWSICAYDYPLILVL